MFHITSSLVGGLVGVTAWALIAPSFDAPSAASGVNSAQEVERVDRAHKSDRLVASRPPGGGTQSVATVEVIGIRDATIVYRDRDGRILFQTDPVSNVTVISKGLVLPQLTVRDTPHTTPTPIETPREPRAAPAIPIGCEPLASPIAEPRLSHLAGRCLSWIDVIRVARAA
jgi:hypothetical protein